MWLVCLGAVCREQSSPQQDCAGYLRHAAFCTSFSPQHLPTWPSARIRPFSFLVAFPYSVRISHMISLWCHFSVFMGIALQSVVDLWYQQQALVCVPLWRWFVKVQSRFLRQISVVLPLQRLLSVFSQWFSVSAYIAKPVTVNFQKCWVIVPNILPVLYTCVVVVVV